MRKRLIVQKYGGSSVATTEKITALARRIVEVKRQGHDVVVVVSAMGGATDRLLDLARQVAEDPHRRELDILLGTGELASMSLLAMVSKPKGAFGARGTEARRTRRFTTATGHYRRLCPVDGDAGHSAGVGWSEGRAGSQAIGVLGNCL